MGDFPVDPVTPTHIHTWTTYCVCAPTLRLNGAAISAPASAAWPSANLAMYIPFTIPFPYTVSRLFWCNGSSAAANMDVGLYSLGGARICSTGSVAQVTTNVIQYAAPTATCVLTPGTYYLGVACSGTTNALFMATTTAIQNRMAEVMQEASAIPLPSPATFASMANTNFPLAGFTRLASGF
jgi:hypothetical protein